MAPGRVSRATARPRRAAEARVADQRATRGALPPRADFEAWAGAALAACGSRAPGLITIRLVGWREGRRLNENFRSGQGATNVLAFAADTGPEEERELGDLVLCLPLVQDEARQQGKTVLAHLAHLVVHGTLHLLGHDHDSGAAARRMEKMETRIMQGLGFADPYRDTPDRASRR